MKLKTCIDAFLQGAKYNFQHSGTVLPVIAFIHKKEVCVQPIMFNTVQDKEDFAAFIQNLIAHNNITEYVMITEAWTASVQNISESQEWMKKNGSLQNYPNRKEVVFLQYCSTTEEITYTAEIIRGNIVSLGEWQSTHHSGTFHPQHLSTRFQGLFAKGKAGHN